MALRRRPLIGPRAAQVDVGVDMVRRVGQHFLETGDRLVEPTLRPQHVAQIAPGVRMAGVECQGPPVGGLRVLEPRLL